MHGIWDWWETNETKTNYFRKHPLSFCWFYLRIKMILALFWSIPFILIKTSRNNNNKYFLCKFWYGSIVINLEKIAKKCKLSVIKFGRRLVEIFRRYYSIKKYWRIIINIPINNKNIWINSKVHWFEKGEQCAFCFISLKQFY